MTTLFQVRYSLTGSVRKYKNLRTTYRPVALGPLDTGWRQIRIAATAVRFSQSIS
jgi:hypothetical protein